MEVAQLFDISPDALVAIDATGLIIQANSQAESLFGYPSLLGISVEMLLPERYRHKHAAHRQHFFDSPRARPMGQGLELFGLRKDGTEFPVDISLKPLQIDGTTHVLAAIRDTREQKKLNQKLVLLDARTIGADELNRLIAEQIAPLTKRMQKVELRMDAYETKLATLTEAINQNSHTLNAIETAIKVLSKFLHNSVHGAGAIATGVAITVIGTLIINHFFH